MQRLEQFKNPHVNEAVADLYSLVFLLTDRRQLSLNKGLDAFADDFALAEAISRRIVDTLADLDRELQADEECGDVGSPPLCLAGADSSPGLAERELQQRNAAKAMGAMRAALGCSGFALTSGSDEGGL